MTDFAARVSRVRMKDGADVHIIEPRANDIPSVLRVVAGEIEQGLHGDVGSIVAVFEGSAGIDLFGWGNIDGLRAIGVLNLGMQKLTSMTLSEIDA